MCKDNDVYKGIPKMLKTDESTTITYKPFEDEQVSIPVFTTTDPVKELYSRLIDKQIKIQDTYSDQDSVVFYGVLREVITSGESVYLRLEYLVDNNVGGNAIKQIIICVGSEIVLIEV
jgi:CHAT domain-containing protein